MRQRAIRVVAVAGVALVGVWAGARIYSVYRAERGREVVRSPAGEATRPVADDFTGSSPDPMLPPTKIPDRLPDFSLHDLEGKTASISAWRGQSLIVNFWATWCAPCQREIPLLEALQGEWAGRGITVIGIAVDQRENVRAYAKQLKIRYPLLIGEEDALEAAAAFGVASPVFPFTVFTDHRGDVVALYLGELHQAEAALILSVVQDLDAGKVALPQARHTITERLRVLASDPQTRDRQG